MNLTNKFMQIAADEALQGMKLGHGGPFGAVIVQKNGGQGEVIAASHNQVLISHDPTMHAEIAAIREATAKLKRFSLHDCEIYSTCMPCPMCLSAIIWAKIPKLYYGATAVDAANAGFDDDYIYEFIKGGLVGEKLSLEIIDGENCRELFTKWNEKSDKNMY